MIDNLPEYVKLKNAYNPAHYPANKKIPAEEWNALWLATMYQGNHQEDVLASILNGNLPEIISNTNSLLTLTDTHSANIISLQTQITNNDTDISQLQTDVDIANNNANDAVSIANTAESNSETAVATANEAKETADNAESVANGIDSKASEALSNSETAVSTANEAKTAIASAVPNSRKVNNKALSEDIVLKTDDISDTDETNKWSTAEEKEKVSKIIINGDGKKALLNDGEYGEVGTVDTVNGVLPDANKNITITADDISDEETTNKFITAEELAQIATNTNNINTLETNKADKATTISGYGIADAYTKTEIESKIASVYKYKGSVANYASLPTEDLEIGYVYNVEDTGDNYAWTGTEWDKLAGTIDLSNYATKSELNSGLNEKFDKAGGTITGDTTFNAFMKIVGTAADRHLLTRGIGGASVDGLTADDLYINYGTDFGAKFGKTGQSRLKPDGGANFAVRPTVGVEEVAFKSELNTQSFSKVYKSLTDLTGINASSTLAQLCEAMADNSYLNISTSGYANLVPTGETDLNGQLEIIKVNENRVRLAWSYQNAVRQPIYFATFRHNGGFLGWKRMITDTEAQTINGLKTFEAPANIAGTEQTTTKFKTSNGGALIIGKEGVNSGTMLRFDQVDGTTRLLFRASATPGAMVWAQPENNAQLLMDLADNNGVNKRIMFNATRIYHPVKIAAPLIQAETMTNGTYNYTMPTQNGKLATTSDIDSAIQSAIYSSWGGSY